jgi:hypothetical protein
MSAIGYSTPFGNGFDICILSLIYELGMNTYALFKKCFDHIVGFAVNGFGNPAVLQNN